VTPQTDAAAVTRYQFSDWDGATTNPISATVPNAPQPTQEITAHFTAQYLLSTATTAACSGSITRSPAPSDGFFDHGQSVMLTAAPSSGFAFTGWSGDLAGTTAQQTITVNSEIAV